MHTIRFEDALRGTVEEKDASEVPTTIAFVGGVPVVRVVAEPYGEQRIIRSYDASGALLESTYQSPRR